MRKRGLRQGINRAAALMLSSSLSHMLLHLYTWVRAVLAVFKVQISAYIGSAGGVGVMWH